MLDSTLMPMVATSLLASFVLVTFVMNSFISIVQRLYPHGQKIRAVGLEHHANKMNTPIMGGLLFVTIFFLLSIVFAVISGYLNLQMLGILILSTGGFCAIGFLDDHIKASKAKENGLLVKGKLFLQIFFSMLIAFLVIYFQGFQPYVLNIFFLDKQIIISPLLYFFFAILVLVATTNSANLTDGIDGLLASVSVINMIFLGIVIFNAKGLEELYGFAGVNQQLMMPIACMIGAIMGFLWFNAPKARIFMGDSGSFAIGGFIATIALLARKELYILVICGIMVMESLSVILQMACYKLKIKRLFLIAPIHHHFERKGWSESQVVFRFMIISIFCGMAGLIFIGF